MTEGRHALTMSAMKTKSGETVRVDLASAALKDEVGRFIGTFTVSRAHGSDAMKIPADAFFRP